MIGNALPFLHPLDSYHDPWARHILYKVKTEMSNNVNFIAFLVISESVTMSGRGGNFRLGVILYILCKGQEIHNHRAL